VARRAGRIVVAPETFGRILERCPALLGDALFDALLESMERDGEDAARAAALLARALRLDRAPVAPPGPEAWRRMAPTFRPLGEGLVPH
jgi:hypothetical protein